MSAVSIAKRIPSIRRRLCKGQMKVSEIEELKDEFMQYAAKVLEEDRSGCGLSYFIQDTLEDFIMVCLDVYTYSEDGAVMIPDYTYDLVMNVYCHLTGRDRISHSDYVVTTTLWPFVKHEAPFMVGTISRKIYDLDTLAYYLKDLREDGFQKLLYAPKFDGVSSAVTVRNGQVYKAVTRNDGVQGQNITEVIKKMNSVKHIFNDVPDGYYKCELVVTSSDFEELVKLKGYSNRRSATSALVQAPSNLPYAEYLTAIPLAWVNFEGTRMQYLAWQHVEEYVRNPESFKVADVYDNIERILKHIRAADYPIRVDGVVMFPIHTMGDEPNTTDLMAKTLAYKVNTQENRTRVDHVYMSVGRMGMGKPMVRVDPVEVNETIVRDVTLGSMARFSSMNLHENEEIIVYSAGDVIPQVRLPEPRVYPKNAERLRIDIHCPYCGKKMRPKYEKEMDYYCLNRRCPRVLSGRIANFLDRLDVAEGFRDATFYQLVDHGVMDSIEDLFTLHNHADRITKILNSRVECDKLLTGLRELVTKKFQVSDVIGALGIENIATKTCRTIFSDTTLEKLLEMKKGNLEMWLMNIEGIGPTTARTFADFLRENRDFLEFLMDHMKLCDDQIMIGATCFTGFRNKEYAAKLSKLGFAPVERISANTVACVYAGDTTTANAKKAISKNVPLVHVGQIDKLVEILEDEYRRVVDRGQKYNQRILMNEIWTQIIGRQI